MIQFATFAIPLGAAGKRAGASRLTQSVVGSGGAGLVGFSGKQEKLSDLIQQYPSIANPVTEYLASDEDDSFLEGRLKNALEFAGVDAATIGSFAVALRGMKGTAKLKPMARLSLQTSYPRAYQRQIQTVLSGHLKTELFRLRIPEQFNYLTKLLRLFINPCKKPLRQVARLN